MDSHLPGTEGVDTAAGGSGGRSRKRLPRGGGQRERRASLEEVERRTGREDKVDEGTMIPIIPN